MKNIDHVLYIFTYNLDPVQLKSEKINSTHQLYEYKLLIKFLNLCQNYANYGQPSKQIVII